MGAPLSSSQAHRFQSGDDWTPVQMNNRVPRSMQMMVERRARTLQISRDEWVRRAIEWALLQPPGTPVRAPIGVRTANGNGTRKVT